MEIICGDIIQLNCDYSIGTERCFGFNQKTKEIDSSRKLIFDSIDKPLDIPKNSKVFCYGQLAANKNINKLIEKLNYIKNPFFLYLHNSDQNFTHYQLKLLNSVPKIQRIYTQNMEKCHEKVFPIPIGLANEMWPHGNKELINKYITLVNSDDFIKKENIFFNFSVNTNKSKRLKCKEVIEKKNIKWIEKEKKQVNYLENLSNYKFAICPEGNGLDTHRFWECLYLKVIPICLKNPLVEHYSKIFPVVLLDKWENLTPSSLKYEPEKDWKNYNELDANSLLEKINNNR